MCTAAAQPPSEERPGPGVGRTHSIPITVTALIFRGSPREFRAWPSAWPSPSGPLGWQRSPGSTALRRRVPRSGMRSTRRGGASPDNARRPEPRRCDTFTALGSLGLWAVGLAVVLAGAAAGYGGDRRRPVTGECAAAAASVGLASEGRGDSCRHATARPRVNPGPPTAGHPGRSSPRNCSRPSSRSTAGAVRPRRTRGAPLKPSRDSCNKSDRVFES